MMIGGDGNDRYYVGESGDVIVEDANAGNDRVIATITYTLGGNLENLTLAGTAAIDGTGNALNNVITGNFANNTLSGGEGDDRIIGGAGNDTMIGGAGNDTYVVDATGDVVVEAANEGNDRVESTVSFTLSGHVETLALTGAAAIDGTGNGMDNAIFGNSAGNVLSGGGGNDALNGGGGNDTLNGDQGNDTLNGGIGVDQMAGGTGNDVYFVDSTSDAVTENANEGTDRVISAITYTLGGNVENLTLSGIAHLDGTGNDLNNVIVGNGGQNELWGGLGNDVLTGGGAGDVLSGDSGDDIMTGGEGEDTFLYAQIAQGRDTIRDFTPGIDTLYFTNNGSGFSGATFVASSTPTVSGTDVQVLYDTDDGRLYYDADATGAASAI